MGKSLFPQFSKLAQTASSILGYSIEELCLNDPENKLGKTQYTQPALYVFNAMSYARIQETQGPASFFAGHSLGEYNALLAAQAFDFETGLRLVQKRGELMSKVSGGAMLAILRTTLDNIKLLLERNHFIEVDIANYNTPTQIILSGPKESIQRAQKLFTEQQIQCIPLNVSGAFHSRYMKDAQLEFEQFLNHFVFAPLQTPVIANVSARPYENHQVGELLAKQISASVLWSDSIRYLLRKGEMTFLEVGDRALLSKMVAEIQKI